MLANLKVVNYALIKELEVQFGPHFNVITGETGTGKSILLGALGLIIGNRADTNILNSASRKCIVEGSFQIKDYPVKDFFENNELDYDDQTIVRREINPSGKSRAFINDTPVTLNVLRELGNKLVDIHSQHQTLKLNDKSFQLSILDSFANHQSLLENYKQQYNKFKSLQSQYNELLEREKKVHQDFDYYRFQLNEINEINPQEGELEELEQELELLTHADSIKSNLQQAINYLYYDENAIQNQLAEVKSILKDIASHNQKIEDLYNRIDAIEIETKDISDEASNLEEEVVVDNQRLEEVNNRLQRLNHLLNKHGFQTIKELLDYQVELNEKINSATSIQDQIESTKEELEEVKTKLNEFGDKISKNRKEQIPYVEDNLVKNLQYVGMPDPTVKFELNPVEDGEGFLASGKDKIQLLFTANRGSSPQPVNQVASGGELSRLMLCVKYIMANTLFLPTIIFDEIDMGISGEIAIKVGQMIKQLSENHQVVTISHLPQVAAMGQNHYLVYKETENEATFSYMKTLNDEERVQEIANMMAGTNATDTTIKNAKELLEKS